MNGIPDDQKIAVLIERVNHIADAIDDLKPLREMIVSMRTEQEHLSDKFRQLHMLGESRGAAIHQLDKRTLILERWHRFMMATPAIILTLAIASAGYVRGVLESIDKHQQDTNSRLMSLEFIVHSPGFEKAMTPRDSRPVAEGGKQ